MTDLEPFPEDWERGLAVVAHPDDMEYGAAAAVARWTEAGKTIGYVLVSDGEAGIATMAPEEAGPIRRVEQVASCAVVGVTATFDTGVRSLETHRVYLENLEGPMASPAAFLRDNAEATGPRLGVELATSFEIVG